MYSRLRAATSAEWGARYFASITIYKAVFMPNIAYAAQIWADNTYTAKAIKTLGSRQRRPLLSVTYAYRSTSTDALCVLVGLYPLDIAFRQEAAKLDFRQNYITKEDYQQIRNLSTEEWQQRWDTSTKGRITYRWFPSVADRRCYPLEPNNYITQFLGEHGDFNGKLHDLKLKRSLRCRCRHNRETAEHVFLECRRHDTERSELVTELTKAGITSLDNFAETPKSRFTYEALNTFAKKVLTKKKEQGDTVFLENYLSD